MGTEAPVLTWEEVVAAARQFPARLVLAVTLWAEGRGEGVPGLVAIAWVIRHRTVARKQTYNQVVLAKYQFSCWPPFDGDENEEEVRRLCVRIVTGQPIVDVMWSTCLRIADGVISGQFPDTVHGAQNYLTTKLYTSAQCPAWAKAMGVACVVGRHTFLR